MPEIELLKLLFEGGSSAVIVYMVWDMRNEQKAMNEKMWTLLDWLVRDKAEAEGVEVPRVVG